MTLLLYIIVVTLRFVRVFLGQKEEALQTGISLLCDSLISIALYFFVFEMFAVREQLESKDTREYMRRTKRNNRVRAIIMIFTVIYAGVYTYFRIDIDMDEGISTIEQYLYIPTFSIKLLFDIVALIIFGISFRFFFMKKRAALQKYSSKFSRFNIFIVVLISLLYTLRIVGIFYDFAVGIVSIRLTRRVLDEIFDIGEVVIHLRDFVEVVMFSYLFYFQS